MSQMKELNHLQIPLQAIKNCTQDFNETNFIGKGGYGRVYKGFLFWMDYQNLPVAVKQLDVTGFQGSKEFYTEVLMLSQYQHKNIVTLIGFCDDGNEMILVYEYASHGSLDAYLSDPSMLGLLSWEKRLNICVGAASALDYLHNDVSTNHRIIHRDIKSANILLDENWNAKLSDFGLSKICLANQQNTFVVTNLAGTHGYCDPQYERTGILTKESDVYSFGVVLFEVLCGRLACVFQYSDERRFLHHFARTCYQNGEVDKIIDDRIREHIMAEPLNMFSAIAYKCLHKTRELRPTIAEVALTLETVFRIQIGAPIIKTSNNPPSQTTSILPLPPPLPRPQLLMRSPPPPLPMSPSTWEDLPGIEGFQIIGDAKLGGKLLGCGYPVHGTSLCMFQWVHYLPDGTKEYIEGATNPEYVVTADDFNKLIAVECFPMDDLGRKGDMVRLIANEQKKIMCDPEMKKEIDEYMSAGQSSFNDLLLAIILFRKRTQKYKEAKFCKEQKTPQGPTTRYKGQRPNKTNRHQTKGKTVNFASKSHSTTPPKQMDSPEILEEATLCLGRSSYHIKVNQTQHILIHEEYNNDLLIKIPSGLASQFVLTFSNGSSFTFITSYDVRRRDLLVLTMRMFQSKALDDIRKSKA